MSLPHFFLDQQVIAREPHEEFMLDLSRDDAHHAQVMRLATGEHIAVIDAEHDYFECEVTQVLKHEYWVRIAAKLEKERALPHVTLVQGLAKGEKMDLVIRHATELGIHSFIPYKAKRCIMKLDQKKLPARIAHWRGIAKSASMQAGRTTIPVVEEPMTLAQLIQRVAQCSLVLVCWEEADCSQRISRAVCSWLAQASAQDLNPFDCEIAVVVGPEGGLTEAETQALAESSSNVQLVSLGSNILRTETAGIVAPALVLYELGGLGGPDPRE